ERTEELLQALDQDPAASLEDVVFLNRFKDRLEARIVRGLREVDRTRAWQEECATSLSSWLRWRCRLLPGQAAEKAALARHLDQLPETASALSEGRIGYQHAAEIARTAELIGAEPVRRQETVLVKAARDLDPHRFRYVTRHLRYCENPDGALREENENHRQRWLTFSQTWNGEFHLEGRLDAEGGAIVQTALESYIQPVDAGDRRLPSQRRADALVELARQRTGGQKPHLNLTVPLATLQRQPGAPAAELEWSLPVSAEMARRLACDCSLSRVVLGADSEPLDVGRLTRIIPPPMKRALDVRDGGCKFHGCDRPPPWCDGHHLVHWLEGGKTSLDNLVLLCRRHHRLVHEEGWRLAWGPDGELRGFPPWMNDAA
ncbi:MAG TPA: DUF222 domain-containing protein, partial [Candidatus Acidoferrales bacterium]|nr:DUF222 domain-containing protein [Candidatus Acidoferrales bacterium]